MSKYIYFSATNTTEKVMEALGADKGTKINVTMEKPESENLNLAENDIVFFGFPVFGGRVPKIYFNRIEALNGNGAKAVIVAVYGNRHYDDAVKEMQAWAELHECEVVAAITAVAQHSIAPSIATGRPDATDIATLKGFMEDIEGKFQNGELKAMPKRPPGEVYKEYKQASILPDSTTDCSLCGICAEECPTDAITIEDACITDSAKCILCMRCTAVCPSGARALKPEILKSMTEMINSRCNGRRETEIFYE